MPYTIGQFAVGLEGLALFRSGPTASDAALAARMQELSGLLGVIDGGDMGLAALGSEVDVRAGYADWASCYDGPNPLVSVEEPAVDAILATWPARWRVLDAGCGTGRLTRRLRQAGHVVTGVDASPEMLDVARRKVPDAQLVEGPLDPLPFDDNEFDAAICALALSHFPDPLPVIRELARVVHADGQLVVSDFHPFMVLIGGQAAFRLADGSAHFVRSYPHLPGAMLNAAAHARVRVLSCTEPSWTFAAATIAFPGITETLFDEALHGLPLAIVWQLAT